MTEETTQPVKIRSAALDRIRLIARLHGKTHQDVIDLVVDAYLESHKPELEQAMREARKTLGLDNEPAGA